MEILKERICENHLSGLLQDSRGDAKLLVYLHSFLHTFVDNFFVRSPLSLGNIHDGRNDDVSHARGHGIEANLNEEFASVFSRTKQIAARSHGTYLGSSSEFLSQTSVPLLKAHWNQYFSRSAY